MKKAELEARVQDLEVQLATALAAKAAPSNVGVMEAIQASDPNGDYSPCMEEEINKLKSNLQAEFDLRRQIQEELEGAHKEIMDLQECADADEREIKKLRANCVQTWDIMAGEPGEKQSKWTKANITINLRKEGKVVMQVRGIKAGKQDVVGGFRPKLMVPQDKETKFEYLKFRDMLEEVEGFKFPLTQQEKLAKWALDLAEKGKLLKVYPVKL